MLQRMRQTKSGYRADDFETLFLGFGFRKKEGGDHTKYIHRDFPTIRATIPRHRSLLEAYARDAVKLLDRLAELEQGPDVAPDEE